MNYQLEVEDQSAYLASTHYIDWQHPLILAKAEELFAGCDTELEKIKAAFAFVRDTIPHSGDIQSHKITHTASEALAEGGRCMLCKIHAFSSTFAQPGHCCRAVLSASGPCQ